MAEKNIREGGRGPTVKKITGNLFVCNELRVSIPYCAHMHAHTCAHTCATQNTYVPVRAVNGKLGRWMAPLHSDHDTSGVYAQVRAPQLDQHEEMD